MLVLTRRNGEALFVTKDIQIRVLGVKGNQVRIGVEAPRGCAIYREEVQHQFASQGGSLELVVNSAEAGPVSAVA